MNNRSNETASRPLATINSVWVGQKLGPIHAACLASFARHGHHVKLYCYDVPQDLPAGVEPVDAATVMPASKIIRYRAGGSLALFSNLFRYELLAVDPGLYVDCDVYCLKPIDDEDYIFGWERDDVINNAVLKLPPDSPALAGLREIGRTRVLIPEWVGPNRRTYYKMRAMVGMPVSISDMPWGTTGPLAVTWHIQQHGLDRLASPIDDFYPVHFDQTPNLFDPGLTIPDITTSRTRLIHLYHNRLQRTLARSEQIPPSSPLGQMLAETQGLTLRQASRT
jgi:hypothetical protein